MVWVVGTVVETVVDRTIVIGTLVVIGNEVLLGVACTIVVFGTLVEL